MGSLPIRASRVEDTRTSGCRSLRVRESAHQADVARGQGDVLPVEPERLPLMEAEVGATTHRALLRSLAGSTNCYSSGQRVRS